MSGYIESLTSKNETHLHFTFHGSRTWKVFISNTAIRRTQKQSISDLHCEIYNENFDINLHNYIACLLSHTCTPTAPNYCTHTKCHSNTEVFYWKIEIKLK